MHHRPQNFKSISVAITCSGGLEYKVKINTEKFKLSSVFALDQWCLRKLLGIKWYHYVRNDEVRRTTGQPRLSAIVQARRLSLFGHIARMPDETDARSIITASPSEDWRRPPGRPRTTWMKTIQKDLRSNNLSLDEAITVAQNRPLWRLMSAFGATHPQWCMPHKKKKNCNNDSARHAY